MIERTHDERARSRRRMVAKPKADVSRAARSPHEFPRIVNSSGDTLIAICAYNEERFIGSVVLQARRTGFPVLVVDDGSSDQTAEIAAAAGAVVLRHKGNLGKAEALNTAFKYARDKDASALVVLDGDGQHDPAELPSLLGPIHSDEADIVIGSRFLSTSKGSIPGFRSLGQRAMTLVSNAGSGTVVTDSQSGFRAFSRRAIETLVFESEGLSAEVEMQFAARTHGLRIVERPITALYPDPPKRNVLRQGAHVLNGILQLVGRHRPLLFFGVPGGLLFFAGVVLGAMVTDIYQRTNELAVGYGLITVLLVSVGLLTLFTGILLHVLRSTFLDLEKRLLLLGSSPSQEQPHR